MIIAIDFPLIRHAPEAREILEGQRAKDIEGFKRMIEKKISDIPEGPHRITLAWLLMALEPRGSVDGWFNGAGDLESAGGQNGD